MTEPTQERVCFRETKVTVHEPITIPPGATGYGWRCTECRFGHVSLDDGIGEPLFIEPGISDRVEQLIGQLADISRDLALPGNISQQSFELGVDNLTNSRSDLRQALGDQAADLHVRGPLVDEGLGLMLRIAVNTRAINGKDGEDIPPTELAALRWAVRAGILEPFE
jgi:hypothetical protein